MFSDDNQWAVNDESKILMGLQNNFGTVHIL